MKLATIQTIKEIKEHPNADSLELAKVLGYTVVVKKGEFQPGDKCLYVAVDSILPPEPEFEFLEKVKYRIKPVKLRGIISQGICFPLSVADKYTQRFLDKENHAGRYKIREDKSIALDDNIYFPEGKDVTEILGVAKYEKPVPECRDAAGQFPTDLLSKTDEERVENLTHIIDYLKGKRVAITIKHDGTSATYIKEDKLRVCSRSLELKDGNNVYWNIARKYKFENLPSGVYLQGEIVGPKIQNNPEGLTQVDFLCFNIIVDGKFLSYYQQEEFAEKYGFNLVDKHSIIEDFNFTYDDLLEISNNAKYRNGKPAEGIVVRPTEPFYCDELGKNLSFKVISPEYAIKHD